MGYLFDVIAIIFPIAFFWIFFVTIIIAVQKNKKAQNKPASFHSFNAPKATTVSHPESHERQVHYSATYSRKNTTKDSGIVDAPLSEAEKNVLYGK